MRSTVDDVADLLRSSPATVFDVTGRGVRHLDACLRRWPGAAVFTRCEGEVPLGVTRITGPRLADRQDWGAQSVPRHGVPADIAREVRRAPGVKARSEPTATLDDYAAAHGVQELSLLLLPESLSSVNTLLGARHLLASGRLQAVAVLDPEDGTGSDQALSLIAGVLGKYAYAWVRRGPGGVTLARHLRVEAQAASWLTTAGEFGIAIKGIINVGAYDAAALALSHSAAAGPLYLIDANLTNLARHRREFEGHRDVTCIGAALSDSARSMTMQVDAEGHGAYVAAPEHHLSTGGKAGFAQFIEVTTCTLDSLSAKYALAFANVMALDLGGAERAALGGAADTLRHLDLIRVAIDYRHTAQAGSLEEIDSFLLLHGLFRVGIHTPRDPMHGHAVYVRKERVWAADPLFAIRHAVQGANVTLSRMGCMDATAYDRIGAARSLPGLREFYAADVVMGAPAGVDVVVLADADRARFLDLLRSALSGSRVCGIVVLGSSGELSAESAMRVAFDHGFLLDRASATAEACVYLRSAVLGDAARWLARNNAFGRRNFRFSALGRMGRFGNQLFQLMHLLLSALRHNAKASICPWEFNDYFQFGFLEGAGTGTPLGIAPGAWQMMGLWGLEHVPDDIDFRSHLQWLAPFLSRHRAFVSACFELKPECAARARAVLESLIEQPKRLVAFHVRRTDYLTDAKENPWHLQIPIAWYRAALERSDGATLYAASDDLEYVGTALADLNLRTYREFEGTGLPPLLIDHCVMRAADTLLLVNSTFSRTAGLFAAESQVAEIPSIRNRRFEPYAPWHDAVFWSRFDDRYFAGLEQHAQTVEAWLTAVGVPALTDDER